ncbi:MAG: ribonuclease J [Clostridia bacterium]|nr:ribonuclease J [Clostridia bacterium]
MKNEKINKTNKINNKKEKKTSQPTQTVKKHIKPKAERRTEAEPVRKKAAPEASKNTKEAPAPIDQRGSGKKNGASKKGVRTRTAATRYTKSVRDEIFLDEIDEGINAAREKSDTVKRVKKGAEKSTRHPRNERKLKVISLGGLGEIGKNITLFEYGDDIVIIDAGLAFPDEDMLGVDLVIPDFSYVIQNAHKVRGLLITHGHEDHIGAVPYLLSSVDVPVYGTRLSLGIIEGKLDENPPPHTPRLYTLEAGDRIDLGVFKAEFIHVNHSIADSCAILLKTPVGNVFHTGDFKLDVSPIDGNMMDLTRIGEIGREGVTLMLCESTNAERAGFTPSERTVGGSLDRIFMQNEGKRLIIATFSSNVHRVQQIINASAKYKRKVAVLGRSMTNILGAAVELGYMELPDNVLIGVNDIKRYSPGEITLITTGSQGEPMSALYRIAFAEHDRVKLMPNDTVVLSSSAIPGNEKLVGKIVNALIRNGVKVVNDSVEDVHVSGHACREEIKLMISLLRPKFFMPIHGEARHLYANKEIAEYMGIPSQNIFVSEIGRVLELDKRTCAFGGSVPSGKTMIDGSGIGDIGSVVLRDRKHLSEDGLVVVVASLNMEEGLVFSGPDIVSRGFVYVKESGDLVEKTKRVAEAAINKMMGRKNTDINQLKTAIRDDVSRFIFKETKRKPMILPILMEV